MEQEGVKGLSWKVGKEGMGVGTTNTVVFWKSYMEES